MQKFAVIDTETNWHDQVMSIGTVIVEADSFRPIEALYHVLIPEYLVGGMFSGSLFADTPYDPILCSRERAIPELRALLQRHGIEAIFAYNACFDRNHLPELRDFCWYDIMRMAAYKQFNHCIPLDAECCASGRLKRGYGVEPMLQLLSGQKSYRESHNALTDALDELKIMELLGHKSEEYPPL